MKITLITLFPEMFEGAFNHSIIKIAKDKNILDIQLLNLRDFGHTKHQVVDDTPFGGGIGMVLKVDVLHSALKSIINTSEKTRIILLDARGKKYDQHKAQELSSIYDHIVLICGHYEGFDERIRQYIDEEISIGDYILTGGEIPALAIVDSVTRLLNGVLKKGATSNESFSIKNENGTMLEYPQYTKPRVYDGLAVPEILLSGNHAEINKWRNEMSEKITKKHRPDLLNNSKKDPA